MKTINEKKFVKADVRVLAPKFYSRPKKKTPLKSEKKLQLTSFLDLIL